MTAIRTLVMVLSIAVGANVTACVTHRGRTTSIPTHSFSRMSDGKQWLTKNLDVNVAESYCYEDAEPNCRRYGRLYTWSAAQQACRSLGDGWRLPTDDEWRQLAEHYGGVGRDSADTRRVSYQALLIGGSSGFDALLGGGRSHDDKQYSRSEAHGFYWTTSESSPATATFYNFARGRLSLFRQSDGEKQRAFSVRCVRE
jgi:uncharacterized protein (TIGR02145 family)